MVFYPNRFLCRSLSTRKCASHQRGRHWMMCMSFGRRCHTRPESGSGPIRTTGRSWSDPLDNCTVFYRYSADIASSLPCMQRKDRQTETCFKRMFVAYLQSPAVILRKTNISLTRRWALDHFTAAWWAMTIWQTSAWSRRETSFLPNIFTSAKQNTVS